MNLLAIDPGTTQSAYVLLDESCKPFEFGKINNADLLLRIRALDSEVVQRAVIEKIVGMGMAVGQEVFDTCNWSGRFHHALNVQGIEVEYITRREEKLTLCGSMKAKDGNIIQALKDRFGDKGTKANPGFFYGFKADCWQAYGVAVTYLDKQKEAKVC